MGKLFRKIITTILDWFLYSVLTEKQKNRLANLFSDKQKEKIKKITKYGKKHSQKTNVKQIKDHLYSLGFTDKALSQLQELLIVEKDPYMRRLVAWELTLWYANKYTKKGAERALIYIKEASAGEKSNDQLRRIAIIEAECLERIDNKDEARQILNERLKVEGHPDLYLGLANLEETIEKRLQWINKTYDYFNLQ